MKASWIFTPVRSRALKSDIASSFGGLDGPGNMQMIGKRIVNGLDFWIGQKFLIRSVKFTDSQFFRSLLRPLEIPRGDGRYLPPLTSLHRREDFLNGNVGNAQHSPCNLFVHI